MTMLTSLEMMFSLLLQRSIYKKIQGILAADGPCCGPIEVLASGRRFPQLLARLSELSSVVTKLGACGPYAHSFQGHQVPLDSDVIPELRPYRSLDASRLKLSGRGEFDATEFLDDDLCMAYRQQLRAFGDVVICMVTCCMILAPGMMVSRLLEQPWMGMMRYLAPWIALEAKEDVSVRRCDSCAFGSPHLKSFRMMAVHMDTTRLARRCSRDHNHVIVEGKYTKASASYTEELAMEIACCFREAILARETQLDEHFNSIHVRGLENQFTNLCATTLQWKEEDAWAFANRRHINLLEMSSLLRLAEKKARAPTSLRVVNLVDSNVIRCAAAKGRSSSEALSTLLLKYNAACLAGDLYFTLPFVPTRFNTSDDPTRGRNVRTPSSKIPLSEATDAQAMGFELGQIFSWALWIYSACLMLFRSAAPCNLLVIKGQLALRSSASLEQCLVLD
ncbi:unnamed protein product [Durusdinium trenchii]|uniref:Uncharacterized protein n=1 Tax=Durusdinium trenchii TaxID=1381693 RepID=A0ABP0HLX9_9DINO